HLQPGTALPQRIRGAMPNLFGVFMTHQRRAGKMLATTLLVDYSWALVMDPPMPPLQKILVATDFSKKAAHAVERAALLARAHHASVRLIHAHRSLSAGVLARVGIRQ